MINIICIYNYSNFIKLKIQCLHYVINPLLLTFICKRLKITLLLFGYVVIVKMEKYMFDKRKQENEGSKQHSYDYGSKKYR